jgi:alanyl-tRNA synthetase
VFQTAFQADAFQNNAFQVFTPLGGDDGGSWTREELKRVKRLHQKIAERQRKLEQATKDANAFRKQAFKDQIDPVAKVKQSKVQSIQKVKADKPSDDTQELQRSISYLERQRDNILAAVAYRQKYARIQAELQTLEAKRLEELDDEESILILLH